MYMDKRNTFGETIVYFSQIKRNRQFCELRYPMCIICIRSGAIEVNVRTVP